jgi:Xaa-Pro aminopeptidase
MADAPADLLPAPFPIGYFRRRRTRIARRLGEGTMILPGAVVRHSSRDSEYPFRPDSELYWATGVREPEAVAVLRGEGDDVRFALFVRERDTGAELWDGARDGPEAAGERHGADEAWPLSELERRLPRLVDSADALHYRLGAHPRVEPLVIDALRRARSRGPRSGSGPRRVVDPGEILDELRLIKDDVEIARIRAAAELTMAGFRQLAAAVEPGVGEWQLQARIEAAFRAGGGEGPAFGTIVGSGANACVLHYVENRGTVAAGELVLVDAGASRGLYAGDVSRTFPASGAFEGAARSVYEAVEAARAAAVASIRPGTTVAQVHRTAAGVLTRWLVDEGLLTGAPDELVADEAYKCAYPHSTSHWLGLDVHDPGDYARDGASRPLVPGMVLTVEPGLYFGAAAVAGIGQAAERFRGIGVRIEDDVLVTPGGHENLTDALPTAAADVAALVAR